MDYPTIPPLKCPESRVQVGANLRTLTLAAQLMLRSQFTCLSAASYRWQDSHAWAAQCRDAKLRSARARATVRLSK